MPPLGPTTFFTTYLLAMISIRFALRFKATGGLRVKNFSSSPNWNGKQFYSSLSSTAKDGDGHDSGLDAPTLSKLDEDYLEKLQKHQSMAAKLSIAEEVRNLVHSSTGHGVLSTNSIQFPGYPTGSAVAFELDEDGLPFFSLSTMSAHTKELIADKKASLVVMAKDFKTIAEGRVTMIGEIKKVADETIKSRLRERYLSKHRDSYWIDFG